MYMMKHLFCCQGAACPVRTGACTDLHQVPHDAMMRMLSSFLSAQGDMCDLLRPQVPPHFTHSLGLFFGFI
jgi:hypothetical protein